MDVLTEFFEDRIITKGTWPSISPDLTPPDFFLWAYLKNSVDLNKPTTVDELKTEIETQIHNIYENTCKREIFKIFVGSSFWSPCKNLASYAKIQLPKAENSNLA